MEFINESGEKVKFSSRKVRDNPEFLKFEIFVMSKILKEVISDLEMDEFYRGACVVNNNLFLGYTLIPQLGAEVVLPQLDLLTHNFIGYDSNRAELEDVISVKVCEIINRMPFRVRLYFKVREFLRGF